MLARHRHRLHHLAAAIALTLGYSELSLAQPLSLDFDPAPRLTATEQISALDAFINDPATVKHTINTQKSAKGGVSLGDANDLVILQRSDLAGVADGGGGDNVLQLNAAKENALGESRNFQGLEVKRGTWTRTGPGDFETGVLIRPKATLINEGDIIGDAVIQGIFVNKNRVGRDVTVLSGGDLSNSGAIAGTVDVDEKGHFAGRGSVGALNLRGRLSVDDVYGAPHVTGDLTMTSSAVLAYAVDPASGSPTIKVDGTALLGDATLKLIKAGDYLQTSQHTIFEAGKVEGKFGAVLNDLAYMTPTLDYEEQRVGLTFTRNDEALGSAANTESGRVFGESIVETSIPPQPIPPDVQMSAIEPVTQDLAEVVSENSVPIQTDVTTQAHAPIKADATAQAATPKPQHNRQPPQTPKPTPANKLPSNAAVAALLTTNKATAAIALEQLAGASTANLAKATLNSTTPVSASLLSAMRQLDGATGARPQGNTPRYAAGNAENGRVWLQALGHGGKLDRDIEPLQHSTKGLLLGSDWRLDEKWHLGLMAGTSRTRLDSRELDGDLDSWHFGAYALRQNGPMSLRLGATYSSHDGKHARPVAFASFRDRPKASYDASTQQAFAEVGYNLGRNNVSIEPFAGLGYQHYQRDGYTEKGGAASLKVHRQAQSNMNSTFGLRMAKINTLTNGMRLTPRLSAGWKHTYGDVDSKSRQRLATGGRDYNVYGAALDRNSFALDAGLDLGLSANHTLGVALTGERATDSRTHGVTGQWRMVF
ncbi:autotransporter domain-containing protein [Pseudomonas syringae]|nr:autotransporter domain-containing protein [Pseudomonas syringae]MCF5067238.1 autotransporter domain-containing protein [Pseudomonas syringae]